MPRRLAAVAAGGAVGATLRALFLVAFPATEGAFPVTIFVENVVGAFLLGVAAAVLRRRRPDALLLQAFLTTGVIGSFTTFSALSLDVVALLQSGRWLVGGGYALASVAAGLLAAGAGLGLGRRTSPAGAPT